MEQVLATLPSEDQLLSIACGPSRTRSMSVSSPSPPPPPPSAVLGLPPPPLSGINSRSSPSPPAPRLLPLPPELVATCPTPQRVFAPQFNGGVVPPTAPPPPPHKFEPQYNETSPESEASFTFGSRRSSVVGISPPLPTEGAHSQLQQQQQQQQERFTYSTSPEVTHNNPPQSPLSPQSTSSSSADCPLNLSSTGSKRSFSEASSSGVSSGSNGSSPDLSRRHSLPYMSDEDHHIPHKLRYKHAHTVSCATPPFPLTYPTFTNVLSVFQVIKQEVDDEY